MQQIVKEEKIAVMLVMEGWDAAGKGGAIKRVTEHLDPRGFQVNPIGAPAPRRNGTITCNVSGGNYLQYGQITIVRSTRGTAAC